MKTYKIQLASVSDVKTFVEAVASFDCDIDLISGRYIVDAKSIMGIFSLELSKPITVNVHGDCDAEFEKVAAPFLIS